jgi:hypothetical protein
MATYTKEKPAKRAKAAPPQCSSSYASELSKLAVGPSLTRASRTFATIDWKSAANTGTIPQPEQFYSVAEAAAVLQQAPRNIWRRIQKKAGIPVAKGYFPRRLRGLSLYLLWEDIVCFLQNDDTADAALKLAYRHWLDYCQKRIARVRAALGIAPPPLDSPITFITFPTCRGEQPDTEASK